MNTSTENYQQTLVRLRKQLAATRFVRWWLDELSSLIPVQMRPAGLDTESFIVVRLERDSIFFRRFDNGSMEDAGSIVLPIPDPALQSQAFLEAFDKVRKGQRDVIIALPAARVLQKILVWPLATEENLRQVLEFQMEENTPFSLAQVYFSYRVAGRDFERNQLAVEFTVTPRDAVDEVVKKLNDWGAVVRAVVTEDMLAAGKLVNLLPAAQGKPPSILMHGINPWLTVVVLLLALTAMAAPLVIKREAVVQLLPWLEKGKTAAEAADALRRNLETRVEEHNYLLEKRQATPPIIVALEELTRILPDDTWVQQLDIKGKELQIQGETASSVRLIGLFEQSGTFHDASFRSPLIKGQAAGTERYQLALKMRPTRPIANPGAAAAIASLPVATQLPASAVTLPSAPAVASSAAAHPAPVASAATAAVIVPASKTSAPAAEKKP